MTAIATESRSSLVRVGAGGVAVAVGIGVGVGGMVACQDGNLKNNRYVAARRSLTKASERITVCLGPNTSTQFPDSHAVEAILGSSCI